MKRHEREVFKWIDTCRRAWNALDEAGIDPDDCRICFQCPHETGKKQIVQITGLDIYLCPRCWTMFGRYASDDPLVDAS